MTGCGIILGSGSAARRDRGGAGPTLLGTMPSVAALAGLPQLEAPSGSTAAPESNLLVDGLLCDPLPPLGGGDGGASAAGTYVGDGMPPVPAMLAAKIRRWEFVEMGELLPEFWAGLKEPEGGPAKERRARQGQKVTEVITWVQCFGTYVAVLAPAEPMVVPELMAYMGMVVRMAQDYEGLGWVRYDSAFRRQAALSGNKKWSVVNSTLFTMNFSGRSSGTRRCELCYATSHSEGECAQRGDPDPDVCQRLQSLESVVLAMAKPSMPQPSPASARLQRPSGEVCRKWNSSGCTFPGCRYRHACGLCGGNHPATRCEAPGPASRATAARLPYWPY